MQLKYLTMNPSGKNVLWRTPMETLLDDPQRAVDHWQFLSALPAGQKTKIPHHPEELLRNVLFQSRHHFTLRQRIRHLLTGIMIMVEEAPA